MVELLRLYNNQTYVLERLRSIMNLEDGRRQEVPAHSRRQRTRLTDHQQAELVATYQAGESVYEIAARFCIARQTVSLVLERHRIKRRYRLLTAEDVTPLSMVDLRNASVATITTDGGKIYENGMFRGKKAMVVAVAICLTSLPCKR